MGIDVPVEPLPVPEAIPDPEEYIAWREAERQQRKSRKAKEVSALSESQVLRYDQDAEFEEALREHMNEIRTFCNSRDAAFISVCTDQPIEKVLFKELLKVGIIE